MSTPVHHLFQPFPRRVATAGPQCLVCSSLLSLRMTEILYLDSPCIALSNPFVSLSLYVAFVDVDDALFVVFVPLGLFSAYSSKRSLLSSLLSPSTPISTIALLLFPEQREVSSHAHGRQQSPKARCFHSQNTTVQTLQSHRTTGSHVSSQSRSRSSPTFLKGNAPLLRHSLSQSHPFSDT